MADRRVSVTLEANIAQYQRALAEAAAATQLTGRATDRLGGDLERVEGQSKRTGSEIDKLSGRLRLFTDAALVLGPALAPLGAFAVGGIVTMSAQLGSLAGALGVTVLAVNGLGDGLKALDAYQLEPTAANLEKLNQEMEKLGPAGRNFVHYLDSIEPELKKLQNSARAGLLPGAEEGIDALLERLPEVRRLIRATAEEVGDLAAGGGTALAGEGFDGFFEYLRTDGIPILDDTAKTIGNLIEAAANLTQAFAPTQRDFSGGLLEWSRGLADASVDLESNAGFQELMRYIHETGPQVVETLGSLANAMLQIVEATAPLGGPVLMALEGVADAVAVIADSDLGTPIFAALGALALYNRAMQMSTKLGESTWGGAAVGRLKTYTTGLLAVTSAQERAQMSATELDRANGRNWAGMAKGVGAASLLAANLSGLDEKAGLSNTSMMALMGTMAGPWGVAAGAAIGYAMDFAAANDTLDDSLQSMDLASASGDVEAYAQSIANAKKALDDFKPDPSVKDALLGFGAIGMLRNKDNFAGIWGNITGANDEAAAAIEENEKHLAALEARGGTAIGTMADFARVMDEATESAEAEAQALRDSVDAMREKRQEALRALDAELNYQQAIDDAKKSLKENGKTVDETTNKGRENLRNLYSLADAWNQQSDAAKNAKGSLADARQNFIQVAQDMGMAEGKAKRLADRLFEIPSKRKTEIQVETSQADAALRALKARMDAIKNKSVTVSVNQHTVRQQGGQLPTENDAVNTPRRAPRQPRQGRITAFDIYTTSRGAGSLYGVMRDTADDATGDEDNSGSKNPGRGRKTMTGWLASAYALRVLQKALDEATKSVDKNKQRLDELTAAQDALISAVGGAYSKADLFSGGLSDFDAGVEANTNDTNAANMALAQAVSNGLDGALYDALAKSGNLTLVQEFAGLSAAEIERREQAFASQSNAQGALGMSAAMAEGLPAAIAAQTKELQEAQKERRQQARLFHSVEAEVKRIGDRVEEGARKGVRDRDRKTQADVRAGR